ncbi:MAG: HlyD family efflux transporter periplasmic adaptor subunit [Cyanobacteria bacterium P01_G01_bin.19]
MFFLLSNPWLGLVGKYCLIFTLFLAVGRCGVNSQAQSDDTESANKTRLEQSKQVVTLGKLVPKGEVIKLSVANAEDSRVNQILVEEGDRVEKNQVIAILQGIERRQRDLEEAEKTVELARAKLAQTQAGDSKQAEIAAQKANISRLESLLRNETIERQAAIAAVEAELRQANLTYERNKSLLKDGAVSQQTLDEAQSSFNRLQASLNERKAQLNNTLQTLKAEINQENENLARIQEIRPVDIRVAEIELERAIIAVEQRKADLEDTKVKVPIAGQILRINTRVGEQVNTQQGIVELGRTDEMYAIAEVYETDISKVKIGQPATISSEYGGFEGKLKGQVEHLGLQIGAKSLAESSQDPTQDENSRVVEVKIRIDPQDSEKVAGLTNMKVRIEIERSITNN